MMPILQIRKLRPRGVLAQRTRTRSSAVSEEASGKDKGPGLTIRHNLLH